MHRYIGLIVELRTYPWSIDLQIDIYIHSAMPLDKRCKKTSATAVVFFVSLLIKKDSSIFPPQLYI
jgi:hypothetical protein